QTHEWAPRVLIANALLVPDWATDEEFNRLEALGLTMYGQMTAGSWIYIGTQGIVQGTYETFAAAAAKRFGRSLAGTLTVTAGLDLEEAAELRRSAPEEYAARAHESMARHCEGMVGFLDRRAEVFDYGNGLRAGARIGGVERAFDYPGFVLASIRTLFAEGK